jgi:DNA topoisomerase VI subunit A
LSIIQDLIQNNQYATKRLKYFKYIEKKLLILEPFIYLLLRDIYYQYKHLFKTEEILDRLIHDLGRTIDVTRTALHIVSSPKGIVAGDLEIIMHDGSYMNCRGMNYVIN